MNCRAKLSSGRCKNVQSTVEDCIAVQAVSVHKASIAGDTAADIEVKSY